MIPTSRTSRIVSNIQGKETHQLFGGPVYYKDKSGNYKDVDMSHADASSAIGNITLREKHSSSVGIRKDGSKTKYLGIRPDETQEDGTNQMEWSIVNVEFDGVSQDIDLSKNDVSGNKVDLGDVIVHNTKTFTRQLVKYNGTATNFKIEFDIHLKNMAVKNNKYDGSYEFRKPCSLAITDIGEDTGQNIWENHILNPLEATDAKKIIKKLSQNGLDYDTLQTKTMAQKPYSQFAITKNKSWFGFKPRHGRSLGANDSEKKRRFRTVGRDSHFQHGNEHPGSTIHNLTDWMASNR